MALSCRVQWGLVGLILLALLVAAFSVRTSLRQADLAKLSRVQEDAVMLEANAIRHRLEAETLSSLYLVATLAAYIGNHPGLSQEEFSNFASAIYAAKPGLVNIAAAPNLVVRFVYPLEGNERAIGFDYRSHPEQGVEVLAVMASGEPKIAGPLDLVQGGVAVIGRFPVFSASGFWGIVSTPILLEQLLNDSGLMAEDVAIEASLRGKDGKGSLGEVFWGDADLFTSPSVKVPVQLFSGSWQLGARPIGGWATEPPNGIFIDSVVGLVAILLAAIVVLLNVWVLRLADSREAEASASRAKSRFLATISHEIRSPLNVISGVAQTLRSEAAREDHRDLTETIVKSANALSDFLTDVLDLCRLEHGTLILEPEVTALDECIDPVVRLLKVEAERKGLTLHFSGVPEELEFVTVAPIVLRQVLLNLLSNAVKFTKTGEVRCHVQQIIDSSAGKFLRIQVEDTGVGIDKSRHTAVFEDYTQEDDSTTREFGGTGLGLAIVKRLVAAAKGSIRLESEKGRGSLFVVDLPIG